MPALIHGVMRCRDCGSLIRLGYPSSVTEHEDNGSIYYAIAHLPGDCKAQAAAIERELAKLRESEARRQRKTPQGSLL